MPINSAQLAAGANYQLMTYATNDPMDQFTTAKPFADWLIANKKETVFSNGIFNEKVRITNASNYQNFQFDDQVTYNTKDTVRLAPFQHYEAFDGFTLNETELANNGIIMTDDKNAVASKEEKMQIVDKLKEGYETLKNGFQDNWDLEVHQDGTQNSKAVPGLDLLISTTPAAAGTLIGGLDPSLYTFWQNQINLSISTASAGTLTDAMEVTWRACMTVGGMKPDKIICGAAFFDAYRKDNPNGVTRTIFLNQPGGKVKGGYAVDNGAQGNGLTDGVAFKGVNLNWDPTFENLDAALSPTIPWTKRCYFLQSKSMKLRPFKGRWMIKRNPSRIYDRFTHYFGTTCDYGITINQRNNMAVLSIA